MNPIEKITTFGQSIWYDNIQRGLLSRSAKNSASGLEEMIRNGDIKGVTSNPSIFHNAISKTSEYDDALIPLALADVDAETIFWELAIDDIRKACDQFLPLYQQTSKTDGYVSLEVNPLLANDTDGTVQQATELWKKVDRPNLMIKIPATKAGLPAVKRMISAGVNINVTLIFSIERYREVMNAYLLGLEERLLNNQDIEDVHSVASFFVSRVDSKIDPRLSERPDLAGKAAIANAKLAYEAFREVFSGSRFGKLQLAKANYQRPLWASTGTKNPNYSDVLYVNELIGPATVNTVPPATLAAFKDHGEVSSTLLVGLEESKMLFLELEKFGISINQVTEELEEEGIKAFKEAFLALLATIDERKENIRRSNQALSIAVKDNLNNLIRERTIERIWANDPSLWTKDLAGQEEIKLRLDWLKLPETSREDLFEIQQFAEVILKSGFRKFLLFGMGGSSLAPEVLSECHQISGDIQFAILDSTDPAQVLAAEKAFPPTDSIYIVSSKSGGTAEINAIFQHFFDKAKKELGEMAGKHFIAITDPGTGLEKLAHEKGFINIFSANPNVGGRYSALGHFGLVPAALMGINLEAYLGGAQQMADRCKPEIPIYANPGAILGVIMASAAQLGKDKLCVVAESPFTSVGSWLEQLVAESTGKQNKGILPIDQEPFLKPISFGADRLVVYLRNSGELVEEIEEIQNAGVPVLIFPISDPDDLGGEFFRWEFATAIASVIIGVNAFDQPDVQDAKVRTNAKIAEFKQNGRLRETKSVQYEHGFRVYKETDSRHDSIKDELMDFVSGAKFGTYIAINAYLPRNPEIFQALSLVRKSLMKMSGVATTLGFGPRFQHSTGQYHKGGTDQGLFLQITATPTQDTLIPGSDLSFGTLELAQALGDQEAILAKGRKILRVHLTSPEKITELADSLQ